MAMSLSDFTERTSDYAKESTIVECELRSLMDSYIKRQKKLLKEIEEAKRDGDVDGELTGESLYQQNTEQVKMLVWCSIF